MTKKHFKAIAATIRRELSEVTDSLEVEAIEGVATRLCGTFVEINPNFDRARFLAACGVEA